MTDEIAEDIISLLAEYNSHALLCDGLDSALIGLTEEGPVRAVYDVGLCVDAIMKSFEIDEVDAMEYLSFNTFCAYVGKNSPVFINLLRKS